MLRHNEWKDIIRICWRKKPMLMKPKSMMIHLVYPRNGKGRLRRSIDACALDFIVQSFQFVRATSFSLHCKADFSVDLFFKLTLQDIPRTFPGHPALNENGRDSLRRLLLAYARHNPSVGYCQVTGVLIYLFWFF